MATREPGSTVVKARLAGGDQDVSDGLEGNDGAQADEEAGAPN